MCSSHPCVSQSHCDALILNVSTKNKEAIARINTKIKERGLDGKTAEARSNFRRISKLIKKEV